VAVKFPFDILRFMHGSPHSSSLGAWFVRAFVRPASGRVAASVVSARGTAAVAVAVGLLCGLHSPGVALALAKHEPESGCYIGAFVERDRPIQGDYGKFADVTRKKHASYITYVAYGRPFPTEWVSRVKAAGAAPHIAFEPNNGLKAVKDDAYLRQWARDAYAAQCPIFLRFASEMNGNWCAYHGDPKLYIRKFRLLHSIMAKEAPNVALVWTVFSTPRGNIPDYYPGDDFVDWVGINIYSVYVHDGDITRAAYKEDPIEFLQHIYMQYADRKPIQISEFAATHYCRASSKATVDFAIEKMNRLYGTVRAQFPRVKNINWFSYNTVAAGLADNNYSITETEPMLLAYREAIKDNYFLTSVPFDPEKFQVVKPALPPLPPEISLESVEPPAIPPRPVTPEQEQRDFEKIIGAHGAVVTSMSNISVRGLADNSSLSRAREVMVLVPRYINVRFIMFEVDGKTVGVTNRAPYTYILRRDRSDDGEHTFQVIVEERDGGKHVVGPIRFTSEDSDE